MPAGTADKQPTNKFGMGCYYHIESVAKNAELLAEKYGADKEVVIIASWLHDIASITDYSMYEEHHVYGAKIAEDILNELNYEDEKMECSNNCINGDACRSCRSFDVTGIFFTNDATVLQD